MQQKAPALARSYTDCNQQPDLFRQKTDKRTMQRIVQRQGEEKSEECLRKNLEKYGKKETFNTYDRPCLLRTGFEPATWIKGPGKILAPNQGSDIDLDKFFVFFLERAYPTLTRLQFSAVRTGKPGMAPDLPPGQQIRPCANPSQSLAFAPACNRRFTHTLPTGPATWRYRLRVDQATPSQAWRITLALAASASSSLADSAGI